jgi:hypothetical protein
MRLRVFIDELLRGRDRLIARRVFPPDAIYDISRGGSIVLLQHGESHDRCGPQRIAQLQDIDAVSLVLGIHVMLAHDDDPFLPAWRMDIPIRTVKAPWSYRFESFPMKRATKASPPAVSLAVSASRATASAAFAQPWLG